MTFIQPNVVEPKAFEFDSNTYTAYEMLRQQLLNKRTLNLLTMDTLIGVCHGNICLRYRHKLGHGPETHKNPAATVLTTSIRIRSCVKSWCSPSCSGQVVYTHFRVVDLTKCPRTNWLMLLINRCNSPLLCRSAEDARHGCRRLWGMFVILDILVEDCLNVLVLERNTD